MNLKWNHIIDLEIFLLRKKGIFQLQVESVHLVLTHCVVVKSWKSCPQIQNRREINKILVQHQQELSHKWDVGSRKLRDMYMLGFTYLKNKRKTGMSILNEIIDKIEVSEALLAWPSVRTHFKFYLQLGVTVGQVLPIDYVLY